MIKVEEPSKKHNNSWICTAELVKELAKLIKQTNSPYLFKKQYKSHEEIKKKYDEDDMNDKDNG